MIMGLVTLLVWLLVLGVIYALIEYVLTNLVPDPPARIIRVVAVVLIGIVAILLILDLVGVGTGLNVPRLNP